MVTLFDHEAQKQHLDLDLDGSGVQLQILIPQFFCPQIPHSSNKGPYIEFRFRLRSARLGLMVLRSSTRT